MNSKYKISQEMCVLLHRHRKASDRINREHIWRALRKRGTSQSIIRSVNILYENSKKYVRCKNKIRKIYTVGNHWRSHARFDTEPTFVSLVPDEAINETKKRAIQCEIGQWQMENIQTLEVCYSDDMESRNISIKRSIKVRTGKLKQL